MRGTLPIPGRNTGSGIARASVSRMKTCRTLRTATRVQRVRLEPTRRCTRRVLAPRGMGVPAVTPPLPGAPAALRCWNPSRCLSAGPHAVPPAAPRRPPPSAPLAVLDLCSTPSPASMPILRGFRELVRGPRWILWTNRPSPKKRSVVDVAKPQLVICTNARSALLSSFTAGNATQRTSRSTLLHTHSSSPPPNHPQLYPPPLPLTPVRRPHLLGLVPIHRE